MPKETNPDLRIIGTDGNAFALLGKAKEVAIKNGMNWAQIMEEATSSDYNNLLAVLSKYFNVK